MQWIPLDFLINLFFGFKWSLKAYKYLRLLLNLWKLALLVLSVGRFSLSIMNSPIVKFIGMWLYDRPSLFWTCVCLKLALAFKKLIDLILFRSLGQYVGGPVERNMNLISCPRYNSLPFAMVSFGDQYTFMCYIKVSSHNKDGFQMLKKGSCRQLSKWTVNCKGIKWFILYLNIDCHYLHHFFFHPKLSMDDFSHQYCWQSFCIFIIQ